MQITQALNQATQQLTPHSETAVLDAALLLSFILNITRLDLLLAGKQHLTDAQLNQFNALIVQRSEGIPIAYLIGKKSFWSLELAVNAHTLVPRPETELVVETALRLFPTQAALSVADLGTGSGAIALSLAVERPAWKILALDFSAQALAQAKQNAQACHLSNVTFLQSDWFEAISMQRFQLIVSNPPYLSEADPHLATGIRHEPRTALVSGVQGLDALTHIIVTAQHHLLSGGWLILEHGFQQAIAVQAIFAAQGYQSIQTVRDFQDQERVTLAQLS